MCGKGGALHTGEEANKVISTEMRKQMFGEGGVTAVHSLGHQSLVVFVQTPSTVPLCART